MSLDFHYVTEDEEGKEFPDDVKHDHICDNCGDDLKVACTESCDPDIEDEFCEDCKTASSEDEEE